MRSDRRTIAFIGAPGDHNSHDDDDHGDDHDVLGQKGKYTLFIFQSSLKRGSANVGQNYKSWKITLTLEIVLQSSKKVTSI